MTSLVSRAILRKRGARFTSNTIRVGNAVARRPSRQDREDILGAPGAETPSRDLRPLFQLKPYVLRHPSILVFTLAALFLSSAATLTLPTAIKDMIDNGFNGQSTSAINGYFLVLLAVGATLAIASSARFYFVSWLGERVVADVRADVFRHIASLSPSFFEKTHSSEVMSRLTADTTLIRGAVITAVSQSLRNGVMLTGAIIMMFLTSLKLSLLVAVAIPFIMLPLIASGRFVRQLSRRAQDELADASVYASENLAAARTMQAYTTEEHVSGRYQTAVGRAFEAAILRTRARAFLTATAIFLVFASVIGILWLGAQDVLAGTMTGGRLAQFVLYAAFAAGAVGELAEVWGELQQAAGAAERLTELLQVKSDIVSPPAPIPFKPKLRGEIAFENVTFSYPSRPGEPVVRGLNLAIKPGERVAVVGPSGAGKTTLFGLLLRFYDPQEGRIVIDGVPLQQASLSDLRQRIAVVSQDNVIFSGTAAENIRYGAPDATDEQVRRAAETALADEFLEKLPLGYATRLGERGVMLSGGQRQRVAIARAILRDAPILLLDEATSALDAESEAQVQAALERVMRGRTTLIIAHRLATVLRANRILVMEDGHIIEEGTHERLVTRGGAYARLAELQFTTAAAE
ncbi:MAG: ATP-binding cassette domain-containing protein [Chitinophagales bacterium]|nr:ATP-binding cassette domain-containing protein [Hyphomicrobiales bacterium]